MTLREEIMAMLKSLQHIPAAVGDCRVLLFRLSADGFMIARGSGTVVEKMDRWFRRQEQFRDHLRTLCSEHNVPPPIPPEEFKEGGGT